MRSLAAALADLAALACGGASGGAHASTASPGETTLVCTAGRYVVGSRIRTPRRCLTEKQGRAEDE